MSTYMGTPPGRSAEYLAANGHVMETIEWRESGENADGTPNYVRVQWNAQHSDSCPCSRSEPLPDW